MGTLDAHVSCSASSTSCLFPVLPVLLRPAVAHERGSGSICRVPEGEWKRPFVARGSRPGALRDQQLWLLFPRLTRQTGKFSFTAAIPTFMGLDFFSACSCHFKLKCLKKIFKINYTSFK